ncbi:unnamed protein product [Miscanthus lutarioriparius]|uniref:Uncharacterized protein n=1 Tax=Miscanthus lutarioriparius TaxID=422564 RepID=A0A811PR81_9POAL|nr:unnamed protein product [Miscanthus lutarioriparius]
MVERVVAADEHKTACLFLRDWQLLALRSFMAGSRLMINRYMAEEDQKRPDICIRDGRAQNRTGGGWTCMQKRKVTGGAPYGRAPLAGIKARGSMKAYTSSQENSRWWQTAPVTSGLTTSADLHHGGNGSHEDRDQQIGVDIFSMQITYRGEEGACTLDCLPTEARRPRTAWPCPPWRLMMVLDETRTAAGEVAAADETMVTDHSFDGRPDSTRPSATTRSTDKKAATTCSRTGTASWQLGEVLSEMAFPLTSMISARSCGGR